jgi:hypothetical protein
LGTPSQYMISLTNSTALGTVMEAADFALIHLVNLSTTTKTCVDPPLVFLNGPIKTRPHAKKRLGNWYGLELMRWHMFLASKKLAPFTTMDQGVSVRYGGGPIEPLYVCFAH